MLWETTLWYLDINAHVACKRMLYITSHHRWLDTNWIFLHVLIRRCQFTSMHRVQCTCYHSRTYWITYKPICKFHKFAQIYVFAPWGFKPYLWSRCSAAQGQRNTVWNRFQVMNRSPDTYGLSNFACKSCKKHAHTLLPPLPPKKYRYTHTRILTW